VFFAKFWKNLTISVHMTTKEYNGIKYGCRVKITIFVRTYGCPPLTKMKTHCLSRKINANSSQMFIIYANIISLPQYGWLCHQIHLIYTLIGVCPTLTKILLKTSLSWKHKCILDIIHHLVTHTPHGQLTSTS